jgi:hypothetical protein
MPSWTERLTQRKAQREKLRAKLIAGRPLARPLRIKAPALRNIGVLHEVAGRTPRQLSSAVSAVNTLIIRYHLGRATAEALIEKAQNDIGHKATARMLVSAAAQEYKREREAAQREHKRQERLAARRSDYKNNLMKKLHEDTKLVLKRIMVEDWAAFRPHNLSAETRLQAIRSSRSFRHLTEADLDFVKNSDWIHWPAQTWRCYIWHNGWVGKLSETFEARCAVCSYISRPNPSRGEYYNVIAYASDPLIRLCPSCAGSLESWREDNIRKCLVKSCHIYPCRDSFLLWLASAAPKIDYWSRLEIERLLHERLEKQ